MDFGIDKIRYKGLALFVLHTVETMCRTFTLVRENVKSLPFLLIALGFASTFNVGGAGYYVDFASGNDNNNGASAAAPWMHCPGDKSALGISAATVLKSGDTVFFKGGVTYQNPQIYCPNGSLVCTGSVASISLAGVLTDANANFSNSGVQSGDLLYIYNGVTNGAFVDTCGIWIVTNITSSTLAVQGFDAVPDLKHELTYFVCRPITFTTNANFGSGPAILDGGMARPFFFEYGNYNRYSGITFQNGYDPGANGCNTLLSSAIIYENSGQVWRGLVIDNCTFSNVWSTMAIDTDLIWSVFQHNYCVNYGQFGSVGGQYALNQFNTYTNGTGGCNSSGAYSIIRFNTIIHMTDHCGYHADCIGPMFSTAAHPGGNVFGWIYGNWCEDATQGIFLTYNNGGTYGWTIANNVVVGTFGNAGIGPGGAGINMDSCPGARIWNNIIIGTNGAIGWISGFILGENDAIGTNAIGVSVKNNIFYNASGAYPMGTIHLYSTATNGFVSEGNVFYQPNFSTAAVFALDNNGTKTSLTFNQWQAAGFDKAGYSSTANPMILQPVGLYPSDFDLLMATNSSALASPYSLPVNLRDAAKVLRVSGAAWDRGPYQTIRTLHLSQPLGGLRIVPQ